MSIEISCFELLKDIVGDLVYEIWGNMAGRVSFGEGGLYGIVDGLPSMLESCILLVCIAVCVGSRMVMHPFSVLRLLIGISRRVASRRSPLRL